MKIKYAVVEDELFTRQRLLRTIANLRPEMDLVFEGASVAETVTFLKDSKDLDLLFMDVELADGNCFQIFDQVSPEVPIIFTTAFDQFALKAFQAYGIGYVLKPYSDEEIAHEIEKFESLSQHHTNNNSVNTLSGIYTQLAVEVRRNNKRILITSGDTFAYINIKDVAAFEMESGVIFVYLKDGNRKMTNFQSMQSVLESVPQEDFFQTGRGLILNISGITKVSKQFRGRLTIQFKIGTKERETVLSAPRRDDFLSWLGNS